MNNLVTELKKLLEEEFIPKETNDKVNLYNIDDGHPIITAFASSSFSGAIVSGGIILIETIGFAAAGILISGEAVCWGLSIGAVLLAGQIIYNKYHKDKKYKENLDNHKDAKII